jgi:MoaD family protein
MTTNMDKTDSGKVQQGNKVRVLIPTPLRQYCSNKDFLEVEATTIDEALKNLFKNHKNLAKFIFNEKGELKNYVNVFLNDNNINNLDENNTYLHAGDTLIIVPSVAGGVKL